MGITELVVLFLTNNSPLYISMTYERKCQKSRGYIESYPQVNIMKGKTLRGRAWPEGTVQISPKSKAKPKSRTKTTGDLKGRKRGVTNEKWYRKTKASPRKLNRS